MEEHEEQEELYNDIRRSIQKNKASGFVVVRGEAYFVHAVSPADVLDEMDNELGHSAEPFVIWENTRQSIQGVLDAIAEYNFQPSDQDILRSTLEPLITPTQ